MDYTNIGVHNFYVFLLVFARVAGVMTTAPFLGSRSIPHVARAGFALVLSLALVPLIAPKVGPVPTHLLLLAGSVLKDALFGLAIGYFARILFSAIEMGGFLMDTQMGFGMINLLNPFSEHQSSLMSAYLYQMSLTI